MEQETGLVPLCEAAISSVIELRTLCKRKYQEHSKFIEASGAAGNQPNHMEQETGLVPFPLSRHLAACPYAKALLNGGCRPHKYRAGSISVAGAGTSLIKGRARINSVRQPFHP